MGPNYNRRDLKLDVECMFALIKFVLESESAPHGSQSGSVRSCAPHGSRSGSVRSMCMQ